MTITTRIATKTSTGVDNGVDVGFDLELEGETISGEVTLLPHEDGRPGFGPWGAIDNWLDGRTVQRLNKLDDDTRSDAIEAILEACEAAAEDYTETEANHAALDDIKL